MTFWNVFFGVFAGIIAGVTINLIINSIKLKIIKIDWKKNLKFEISYNIEKLDSFLEEINTYRNMTNGDSLLYYFGYFKLSSVLLSTINQSFNSGLIYKYLKKEDVRKLQNFVSEFSIYSEKYINDQINFNKHRCIQKGAKQEIVKDIDFWEKKFKDYKKFLASLEK